MRAKKTITILFLVFGIMSSYGQCNSHKEKHIERYVGRLTLNPNIQVMTDLVIMQSNQMADARGSFFSDDNGGLFFLLFFNKPYFSDYEIQKGQELIFYFENGMGITLTAFTNFTIWIRNSTYMYFEISREQIEILAKYPIDRLQLYFTDTTSKEEDFLI